MKIIYTCLFVCLFTFFSQARIVYKFIGNANWSDSSNWENRNVPPDIVMDDAEIIIAPVDTGECLLDIPQYISIDGKMRVSSV